jgi:hypothetical protein
MLPTDDVSADERLSDTTSLDANFIAMVGRLLDEDQQIQERRGARRREFACVQLIAPIRNGLPNQSEFRHVQCHDLSARGFSYHVPDAPDFQRIIVALGAVPFTFLSAEVVRVTEVELDGRRQHHIGCRFDGRVEA